MKTKSVKIIYECIKGEEERDGKKVKIITLTDDEEYAKSFPLGYEIASIDELVDLEADDIGTKFIRIQEGIAKWTCVQWYWDTFKQRVNVYDWVLI